MMINHLTHAVAAALVVEAVAVESVEAVAVESVEAVAVESVEAVAVESVEAVVAVVAVAALLFEDYLGVFTSADYS